MYRSEIIKYLKLLLTKWVLWLFVLLDVIGVSVQFFIPNLTLPPIAYGFFAIVGFFWAGYQVYAETIQSHEVAIETYRQKLQKLSDEINISAILKEQNLSLSLVEGHEYSFEFNNSPNIKALMANLNSKDKSNQKQSSEYFLPSSGLNIYLRIENIGCDSDILVIQTNWDKDYNSPFDKHLAQAFLLNDTKVEYPIPLKADNYLECVLKIGLPPKTHITNAQFASLMRDLRESGYLQKVQIGLESVNGSGEKKTFSIEQNISFRPMVDLYVEHWQSENQTELIRLAGGVTKKFLSATTAG